MGFRLTPIFIQSNTQLSEEEVLQAAGLTHLQKGMAVPFYDTSKQYDRVFTGHKNNCSIVCNGPLAYAAFDEADPFELLTTAETTVIIWDETSGVFGFCWRKNGQTIRKVMVIEETFECNEGSPLPEELAVDVETLFDPEEKEEIIEEEGEEAFAEKVKAAIICRAANELAKRYLGAALMQLQERIEMYEWA